ncbi:MAG: hypothetical protein SF182_01565 [Deltaproteobacteria bacterium]|nr:hypothetical protein [Deltaproteobacteria bacterium]
MMTAEQFRAHVKTLPDRLRERAADRERTEDEYFEQLGVVVERYPIGGFRRRT